MARSTIWLLVTWLLICLPPLTCWAEKPSATDSARGDDLVHEYFRQQTQQLTDNCLADIQTLEDWTERRAQYHEQLLDMLGLNPMPPRSDLQATVTDVIEQDGLVVENLHFQSMPGLYVTGNLYRPADQGDDPLPAVLYVCGHGRVVEDGVSLGNKAHYQHHGAWFARNGYVCLVIDTIQLGELEGIHHGTYRERMWWWNNRGYTPAGVEAWNGVRALDYLQSRPEVDGQRIGVTGRSGGGAYSWWLAAIDQRIRAAVPVAGITSLKNHVVDDCVEGHCDCMFMVNTYRWDFPMVAALVAPRPLLISNTDRDGIFPLDGVVDVHAKVRRIYELYDAPKNLGLHITSGPHHDTQELRIHAFRWFNRHLRNDESLIDTVADKRFEPRQLKVFDELPSDQRTTSIHESFVPAVDAEDLPGTRSELQAAAEQWMQQLETKTFGGWPQGEAEPLDVEVQSTTEHQGTSVTVAEFTSQRPYRLPLIIVQPRQTNSDADVRVVVLDQTAWRQTAAALAVALPERYGDVAPDAAAWQQLADRDAPTVFIMPRGVGPTAWSDDDRAATHIRRRFMLLGQTAAGMQIYDVQRGLAALRSLADDSIGSRKLSLHARGTAAFWAVYASLFSQPLAKLQLQDLPTRNRDAPDLLNVSRIVEMPHVVLLASLRCDSLQLSGETSKAWRKIAADQPLMSNLQW
ncbi:alpha/beta hydrolase family protein [Roseimaritima ulvae]|uniref:Alpha/beta hydrolase family protein n=1 Tax=Roseimaritima ulvae TaxID=980254 RepID=A0A5B9QV69_9BACT|nr:CocE/NonD family hydrolase [Roseimaritima ulvae]QEG42924.1 Alpha/beta hydrolase family protein [Roseimaritima ulvae]